MAGRQPSDQAQLREKVEQPNQRLPRALPKVTRQNVELLVNELHVCKIELELQCQEHQRTQAEVEESRDRYRELYESIPIGYVTIDATGRIYDVNPAGVLLLGMEAYHQELQSFFFFFSDAAADVAMLFIRSVLTEQKSDSVELKMKGLDGKTFVAAIQAVPVKTEAGKDERLRIAFTDVSRRKEMEEALRQQQVELEGNRLELQDLMAKLFTAQEEERRRIACDLHDDHCQRITAMILEVSAVERLVKTAMPSLMPRMASFKRRLSDILDDFRHLTHELHPRHLDTVSPAYSMRTYIKEFVEYANLPVEFIERDVPAHLPMPITVCLYRLLQESLGNIRKHANAKHVKVGLSCGEGDIVLSVSDDGAGFEFSDHTKGLGLTSMQERVRPLRGRVSIDSKLGTGTCVSFRIPVPSEN